MKKALLTGIVGIALLVGGQVMAADKHDGDYCAKHCNTMQLSKEVKALEKEIAADKAALKNQGTGEKAATLNARKEQVKKHVAQHEKELADLKARLEKAEAEMAQ